MGTLRTDTFAILVAADFSSESELAISTGRELALRTPGSSLHIVHAVAPASAMSMFEPFAGNGSEMIEAVDSARGELDRVCSELAKNLPSSVFGHLRIGKADVEIVALAREISADMMIVGTHGRRGVSRALLGSVAELVVRTAPCPVLVTRPKEVDKSPRIEPACPACLETRRSTGNPVAWCARHSEHHPRAHTYSELPPSFGLGSQTFRFDTR